MTLSMITISRTGLLWTIFSPFLLPLKYSANMLRCQIQAYHPQHTQTPLLNHSYLLYSITTRRKTKKGSEKVGRNSDFDIEQNIRIHLANIHKYTMGTYI
jgi:hypothetical protein